MALIDATLLSGGFFSRREDRCQPPSGQEHDRGLLPASGNQPLTSDGMCSHLFHGHNSLMMLNAIVLLIVGAKIAYNH